MKLRLINSIYNVWDELNKISKNYKGIYFFINQDNKIYVKIDKYSFPHLLGLNRIKKFKNKKPKEIYYFINKNKLNNNHLNTLLKKNKSYIKCKLDALKNIIEFIYKNDPSLIRVSKPGTFKTHKYDCVIELNGGCLVLIKHNIKNSEPSFSSYSIQSIREINCFKNENKKIEFMNNISISYYKLVKHNTNQ